MNSPWIDKIFHENTKEGIHKTAKDNNLRPWALGCQCSDCDKEFSKLLNKESNK